MSLLFIEGFACDNISERWVSGSPTIGTTPTTPGSHSASSARLGDTPGASLLLAVATAADAKVTVGFLLYIDADSSAGNVIQFRTQDSVVQCGVKIAGTPRKMSVYRTSNPATVVTTGTYEFDLDTWYYVELQIQLSDTVGIAKTRVNGDVDIDATGLDTLASGSDLTIAALRWGGTDNQNDMDDFYITDIYVLDDAGTVRNDFLGEVEVKCLEPNADGFHTDFTPLSSTNISNVDETGDHDGDTSYNAGTTAGDQDSFDMTTITGLAGRDILGLQAEVVAEKNDSGTKYGRVFIRPASTDDFASSYPLANGSYELVKDGSGGNLPIWERNPDDNQNFEQADIDGLEVGIEARDTA